MPKSLSPEAIEALRRLNDVGVGQMPPDVASGVAAELLRAGVVAQNADHHVEINCDGRKYLSGDCD